MYQEQGRVTESPGVASMFDPQEGALGIAMHAISHPQKPIHVSLPGGGEFWLDPIAHRAVWRMDDWDAMCAAASSRLKLSRAHLPEGLPSRPQAELMWRLGYHSSSGRLPHGVHRLSVVKMRHWPNLTRLPHTPDMHRLCALFVRRPTSLHLAGKMLALDERDVFRFFSAAYAAGVIAPWARESAVEPENEPVHEAHSETSLGAMLRQMWGRMSGR